MRGYAGLMVQAPTHCPRSRRIPAPRQRPLSPGARARGPTDQEVEDGHVDDVEKTVAAVVRVGLLHGVAVKRIDLPPGGEKKSWGWKSQDGNVLGALLTPPLTPPNPCLPDPSWGLGFPGLPQVQWVSPLASLCDSKGAAVFS